MNKSLKNAIIIGALATMSATSVDAGWRDLGKLLPWNWNKKPAVTQKNDCHKGGRSTKPSPKREVINPQLDMIVGKSTAVGNFCEAGDAVKLVLPDLTDAQRQNGYKLRLEMEGKPKFSWFDQDLAIDGDEIRSGKLTANDLKYVNYDVQDVTQDGVTRKQYRLVMPKDSFSIVLRDKHGHKKAEKPFGMTVKAYDCVQVPAFIGNIFINAPNAQLTPSVPRDATTVEESTYVETPTLRPGRRAKDYDGFRLTKKNPWAITGGVRNWSNTLETAIQVKDKNGTRLVPHEEVYSGNALLASLEYATPNIGLSLRYADSFGTDGSGNDYHNTAEKRVDAQALTGDLELLYGKGKFKIGGFFLGEAKTATFSEGAGIGVDDVTLRNRNTTAIPGAEVLIGTGLDDQYLKFRAGAGIQDMEFQRPDNTPSSPNRGSGVRDTLLFAEVAGRKNVTEGITVFGNYRYMRTLQSESTTPLDEVRSTQIDNSRLGLDVRLFGNENLRFIVQAGHVRERAQFPDGVWFNNTGTVYDGIIKYHFGK